MIIAIASQKGGVGKTSSAISLAAGLARKGKKTLLIDIDSQANSSKVLLPIEKYSDLPVEKTIFSTILERKPLVVHKTDVPNLSLVPSHILLSNTDIELTTALDHREARLKAALDPIAGHYDFVFIDCPPT